MAVVVNLMITVVIHAPFLKYYYSGENLLYSKKEKCLITVILDHFSLFKEKGFV